MQLPPLLPIVSGHPGSLEGSKHCRGLREEWRNAAKSLAGERQVQWALRGGQPCSLQLLGVRVKVNRGQRSKELERVSGIGGAP